MLDNNFDKIKIVGAKENNLKNLSLEIDKHKFNVVTGVSGSGKSSLVFDCIYAMAQTSFYETLSTYVVKNLPKINKPNVDKIVNLSPCVLVEQRKLGSSPRSTVGTYTEIYTYLRLLYSRIGYPIFDSSYFSFNTAKGACKKCGGLGVELVVDLAKIIDFDLSLNEGAIKHRTWKVDSRYFNIQKSTGYFDMNKKLKDYSKEELDLLLYKEPTTFMNQNEGFVQNWSYEGIVSRLIKRQSDSRGLQINDYDREFFKEERCSLCEGARLNEKALSVKVHDKSLKDLLNLEIVDLYDFILKIDEVEANEIVSKMKKDLKNLIDLGIGYLTLNRSVGTLSGGEAQKIKLAKSMSNTLNELIYIMDEPSLGFHSKDVSKIIKSIKNIVANNNTAIVVEHNREIINNADNIIDIGPESGRHGGELIYSGSVEGIKKCSQSITGQYLNDKKAISNTPRQINGFYEVKGINTNNIKDLDVKIPLNVLTCITGVSGSGKSSLIRYLINSDKNLIKIGKDNIGINCRSNVATYTKTFDIIRDEFSKATNVPASEFSFNSTGACPNCDGAGVLKMDMHFLGDVKQVCEICHGKRYKEEVLKYLYKNKNINEVLEMTVEEALNFFDNKDIIARLEILKNVGLEYLKLGQTLDTLSGGEVGRVNMSKYLVKKGNIYIFDEPTQGLHLRDIEILKQVMNKMLDNGNTIIVIEHNLDFIIDADYIIDMGPDAGKNGGRIVYEGYLKDIVDSDTYTSNAVKHYLS
ncbi:MAG: excinuclease ABC subunit UvrA [Erysipelotrichales bacterium]|nr:excinuclease ABC subunit UvrA [Erysipelotrichales bacterium]